MSGNHRKGPCNNLDCEAHTMRVPLYTRERLCRDCQLRVAKGGTVRLSTQIEPIAPQSISYKYLTQEQLRELVDEFEGRAELALDDAERKRFQHKARRARSYLPAQECALPGCSNICIDGNKYCSSACAGQANISIRNSATKEQLARMQARKESKQNRQPQPIYSDAEVVRVPEINFGELWNGRGGEAAYCPVF